MKKVMIGSLIAGSALLSLSGCNKTEKKEEVVCNKQETIESKSITIKQEETPMARQKTNSGLQYEIIKEGSGETPKAGQKVTVHYDGWLEQNADSVNKFDSSVDRGRPFSFNIGVGQVIRGWDEGVLSMKVGEKRRLIIPSDLGYGAQGAGRSIPPFSTLVFDVELLKIG